MSSKSSTTYPLPSGARARHRHVDHSPNDSVEVRDGETRPRQLHHQEISMNTSPASKLRNGVVAITAATALLFGCSSDDSESSPTAAEQPAESISIELARAPLPAPGQTATPVYGILVNDSLDTMRVISATSTQADTVDLLDPNDAVVLPTDGFEVKPDGGLIMEPVGFKLMLNGIDPVAIGQEIPVTLRFDSGESFDFTAIVQELDQ